jgi:hypothetical protein
MQVHTHAQTHTYTRNHKIINTKHSVLYLQNTLLQPCKCWKLKKSIHVSKHKTFNMTAMWYSSTTSDSSNQMAQLCRQTSMCFYSSDSKAECHCKWRKLFLDVESSWVLKHKVKQKHSTTFECTSNRVKIQFNMCNPPHTYAWKPYAISSLQV